MKQNYDVIIIGAGAAGLFCAFNAAARGKSVLVVDHANKVGKKILMSGGGRCNFTNLNTAPDDFYSQNRHFCKSALSQYTAYDFLALVERHGLEYVEKEPGQLFCKNSSKDMLKVLLDECAQHAVKIYKKCEVNSIKKENGVFTIETSINRFTAEALVVATGGLSIPTLGATDLGYAIARQFGHEIIPTTASLVPFILSNDVLRATKDLAGVSTQVEVSIGSQYGHPIRDKLLFTHRGLSGPAILKISMYWSEDEIVNINLLPSLRFEQFLEDERGNHPQQHLINCLSRILPRKLASYICNGKNENIQISQLNKKLVKELAERIHNWKIIPVATEGYKTAEVTRGGVSTDKVSSRTMESKIVSGLYFVGEVLDVTGQLGGYNFQWAWSSAWCAAQSV